MLSFIQRVFKNQKKTYFLLLGIFIILSSFEFSFLAIYDAFVRLDFSWEIRSTIHLIPVIGAAIALMLNVFITKYFMENKKQEFSILLLAGTKTKDLFYYLSIQFGFIILLSAIIGVFGGMEIMHLIHYYQSHLILQYSFTQTIFYYLCFLIITYVLILAIGSNQFISLDLNLAKYLSSHQLDLKTSQKNSFFSIDNQTKKPFLSIVLSLFILVFTFYSMKEILNQDNSVTILLFYYSFALMGLILIITKTIPLLYDLFHHQLLKHPICLNALALFQDFTKVMSSLILLVACIIPTIFMLLLNVPSSFVIETVTVPCFIMIMIMIVLCFILRFTLYLKEQQTSIATIHAVGYDSKKLNNIVFLKNLIFFILGILIPLAFILEILYLVSQNGVISQSAIVFVMIVYTALYTLIVIYMLIQEKIMQRKVINNVKYLNRGE